jgi:hypothetical protein
MIVKEVSIRRVFNLGNYETKTIELVASISETESLDDVIDSLTDKIYTAQNRSEK